MSIVVAVFAFALVFTYADGSTGAAHDAELKRAFGLGGILLCFFVGWLVIAAFFEWVERRFDVSQFLDKPLRAVGRWVGIAYLVGIGLYVAYKLLPFIFGGVLLAAGAGWFDGLGGALAVLVLVYQGPRILGTLIAETERVRDEVRRKNTR
jgi:hypothetical protein